VAGAVHYYVSHSFSVQSSKEIVTVANNVHVSGQLLSHFAPMLGQLVHVTVTHLPMMQSVMNEKSCCVDMKPDTLYYNTVQTRLHDPACAL
jgi:hypothetical protein